jgi:hypothetical protein
VPVTTWNTTYIDGKPYLVIDVAKFRIPLDWDPSSNMFMAVAAPDGGLGNFPALVRGDDGFTPDIDTVINFEAMDWDNPSPDYASWTEVSANLYKLNLGLHTGRPGDSGVYDLMDADDIAGTAVAGQMLVVNSAADGFLYVTPKVGDEFWPAGFNNTPSGQPQYTLGQVSVPPQGFAWRPDCSGWCVITGTGADVRVDLVARLNIESSGNILARGRGMIGQNLAGIPTILASGPVAGSANDYNIIPANTPAIIYFRAERTSGAMTFTTNAVDTWFNVKVRPVP